MALRRYSAEVIGTALLVFVEAGVGTVDAATRGGHMGVVARYLGNGLMVTAMIYSLSGISGAHINPAVTLAFLLRKNIMLRHAIGYWVSQFVGAAMAAEVLWWMFGAKLVHGTTRPEAGVSWQTAFAMETILTFILIFVVLSTSDEKAVVGKNAALAIGFTVVLCGLLGGPVCGASMNPARSFGPALVSGHWGYLWIYFTAPALGAAGAAVASLIHVTKDAKRRV